MRQVILTTHRLVAVLLVGVSSEIVAKTRTSLEPNVLTDGKKHLKILPKYPNLVTLWLNKVDFTVKNGEVGGCDGWCDAPDVSFEVAVKSCWW